MRPPSALIAFLLVLPLSHARADRLVLVAGGGDGPDGTPAARARLRAPFAVDFGRGGEVFIAELTGERVRKIDPKGILTTLAGTGEKGDSGDGGPARLARFNGMHHLLVAPGGDLYIADTWNNRVRKIDARTETITAFAGTGQKGLGGDGGPAARALLGGVYCLALDQKGERMFVVDLDNRRIRAIELRSGRIDTVAGNGERGVPPDGADARSAPLVDPRAVAVDSKGNVYILERSGHALRVVEPAGKIRTVAGTGAAGGGDVGEALKTALSGPKHLAVDRDDTVLVADTDNHRILRFLPREGRLARIAGSGKKGAAGVGGPPLEAELNQPHGVSVHPSGAIYIADSENHRVLRIDRD